MRDMISVNATETVSQDRPTTDAASANPIHNRGNQPDIRHRNLPLPSPPRRGPEHSRRAFKRNRSYQLWRFGEAPPINGQSAFKWRRGDVNTQSGCDGHSSAPRGSRSGGGALPGGGRSSSSCFWVWSPVCDMTYEGAAASPAPISHAGVTATRRHRCRLRRDDRLWRPPPPPLFRRPHRTLLAVTLRLLC